ncbi:cytochrome c [Mucilaginibacter mali]|uniref:Cytochrome c n=1 Tax=Mucilaginibacter mali TaxID=2740462 RepID=A0A7D4QAK1_9SPHI|nr:cytochrome c [Mucilaginibacter mali]QKJ30024.1 cytochrome c [Mucilaginibacter mali]
MRSIAIISALLIVVALIASCQTEQQVEFNRYYATGAAVYQAHCQNCHGDKGQGLAALIPPLTDTTYLRKNRAALPCAMQLGVNGKITVSGKEFEGQMPATELTPIEIAEVLTYVTNSFGNKQGLISDTEVEKGLKGCK